LLRSCFTDLDTSQHIHIFAEEIRQKRSRSRSLRIEAQTRAQVSAGSSRTETFVSGVKFRFAGPSGEAVSEAELDLPTQALVTSEYLAQHPPLKVIATENKDLIFSQFISPYLRPGSDEVYNQVVSALKDKKIDQIVSLIALVEPRLKTISPIMEWGQPNIYVDIGRPKLLPIALLGSGFFHLLRLAGALAQIERGILIIDELEDGLHYSILPKVARAIFQALENRNLQVFISTHSSELINTFIEVAKDMSFSDLGLINMGGATGKTVSRQFRGDELQFALDLEAELR